MSASQRRAIAQESETGRLLAAPPDGDLVAALRRVLKMQRPCATITLSQTAKLAGVSVRTLQRNLHAAGWSYSGLVEEARMQVAMEMLRNQELSLDEIAHELGYSALPNFTRAFGRWSGTTPSEFRQRHRSAIED